MVPNVQYPNWSLTRKNVSKKRRQLIVGMFWQTVGRVRSQR